MPSTASKPTLTFFKLLNCSACTQFENQIFNQLIQDQEVLKVVNVDQVVFGRDADGTHYDLRDEYPDFVDKVKYAPYLWLSRPYDETKGHHLNASTMNNPSVNTRLNGEAFAYRVDTTYENFKDWILNTARQYQGFRKASQHKKTQ